MDHDIRHKLNVLIVLVAVTLGLTAITTAIVVYAAYSVYQFIEAFHRAVSQLPQVTG
jgi:hypothetical protein